MLLPSPWAPPEKGRTTPLLLLPPPLPIGLLRRRGWRYRRGPRPQGPLPGAVPLDTRVSPCGTHPLAQCLALGGRSGDPPAPFLPEVGAVRAEA